MPTDDADRPRLVVGLGNPGREYARTRHNVGFMVLDALRRRWELGEGRRAFEGRLNDARVRRSRAGERRVLLLAPRTYMNRSGLSVRQAADFYKVAREDVLVVLDDTALPPGRLRARASGSAGGHNGLADVLLALGGQDVARLRIGIGSAPAGADPKDFVLHEFTDAERKVIGPAALRAAEAVEDWVFRGIACVMDRYNRKTDEPDGEN